MDTQYSIELLRMGRAAMIAAYREYEADGRMISETLPHIKDQPDFVRDLEEVDRVMLEVLDMTSFLDPPLTEQELRDAKDELLAEALLEDWTDGPIDWDELAESLVSAFDIAPDRARTVTAYVRRHRALYQLFYAEAALKDGD